MGSAQNWTKVTQVNKTTTASANESESAARQRTMTVPYRQPNSATSNMEMRINEELRDGWRFVGSAENESLNGDGSYSRVVTLVFER
jgi:hypothetical protein